MADSKNLGVACITNLGIVIINGDALIATCLLLGVEFSGDETNGFVGSYPPIPNGLSGSTPLYYSKRACAARALIQMGYKIHADGDVTLGSK
jgi:hypothetical protein